jgi:hypothetical protein
MAIGSLRTPFRKHVAFFKIGASFLQCAHQDMKNSTITTSDLLPQGMAKVVAPPGNSLFEVQVSAGLACQSQASHKLRIRREK